MRTERAAACCRVEHECCMASSVAHAHGVWSGGLCPITCEQDQKLHRLTQQINRQKGQPHTRAHTHSLTCVSALGWCRWEIGHFVRASLQQLEGRVAIFVQVVADAMLQLGACARMRFKGARQTQVCGSLTRASSGRGASGAAGCTTRSAKFTPSLT